MVRHRRNGKGCKQGNTGTKGCAVYYDNDLPLSCRICFNFLGGVIGFFVLSSYFLTRKVMRNDVLSFEEQVKYRLKRLYPAYLVLIVIAFLASLWRRLVPWDIVIYIAFFQNLTWRFPVGEMSMAQMMAHTWTLSIEVWMGSVWLFLLMRIRREYWKTLCYIAIVCSIVWRIFIVFDGHNRAWISMLPVSYADIFALGTLLAIKENDKKKALWDYICGAVGIVGIGITWIYLAVHNEKSMWGGYILFGGSSYYLSNIFTVNIYFYIGLLFYAIISEMEHVFGRKECAAVKLFSWIGNCSYELYLFHYPFLTILVQAGLWRKWYQNFVVCLFGAAAVTFVWHRIGKLLTKGRFT